MSEKKSRKSKKNKSETKKEEVQQQPQQQVQEDRPSVPQIPQDFDIRMKFSFLKAIQEVLLRANAKVHWDPEDLIPAGMLIRDVNNIIKNLEKEQIMIQVQNQLNMENDEEDPDEESEEIN